MTRLEQLIHTLLQDSLWADVIVWMKGGHKGMTMCVDGDVVRTMILHCPMMTNAMVNDQKLDLSREHLNIIGTISKGHPEMWTP